MGAKKKKKKIELWEAVTLLQLLHRVSRIEVSNLYSKGVGKDRDLGESILDNPVKVLG